jgi:alpha-beta hydrolase superfamily lysophospholipase
MNSHWKIWEKPVWRKRIGWSLIIYLGLGLLLNQFQEQLLFQPKVLGTKDSFDFNLKHEELLIPLNKEDSLSMVRFLPASLPSKGTVLYFHGNKKNIGWYARFMPAFTQHGYEVLMIDYPGYGKSRGIFTEKKLYDWAKVAYQIARKRHTADRILIYGKSLGTGIAAQLASVSDCKGLILETPYYDFPSVLTRYIPFYPIRNMLHFQLPTYQYLPLVTAPITLLHGTSDWTVSYSNSKKLLPLLKPGDQLLTIEGAGHNELFEFPPIKNTLDSILSR